MKAPITCAVVLLFTSLLHAQYSWRAQFPSLPAFQYPTELIPANDGTNRLFVVQQYGIIYVFNNSPAVGTRKVFLDISDRVSQDGGEMGLLGMAFHPDYRQNGYFYVDYTSSNSGTLRSYITRYKVSSSNPDSALHDSEDTILVVDQPYDNHNGGKLAFGPDGYLYIGFGDGGSEDDPENRGQDRTTLLGKILRINIDSSEAGLNYAIPATNPYYKNQLGYRQEIYAYGIRNPWKFSFDPVTASLWLGDVGQDTREEVDIVRNGGNYGWRLMEGFICTPVVNPTCQDTAGLLPPIWDYPHNGNSAAITGGYVYRGVSIPSLYGKYIFGDYVTGRTWALAYDGVDSPSVVQLSQESYSISTFGVDTNGEIYLCSYSGSAGIYKLTGPSTGVKDAVEESADEFGLSQNYPNPFNPSTLISYRLPSNGFITLKVYDLLGREVETLVSKYEYAGQHVVSLDGSHLATGVYFYQLKSEAHVSTKKLLLVK
ncbi:MAG: PQQ-dependent sugar dehydrogenase [Candidatus Kryptoniota bacterium]